MRVDFLYFKSPEREYKRNSFELCKKPIQKKIFISFKIFFGLIRQPHYKLHNWV
jgi:hypothetical protein